MEGGFDGRGGGPGTATLVGWGVHLVSPYVAENERHPSSKDGSDQDQPEWERRRRGDGKGVHRLGSKAYGNKGEKESPFGW